MNQTHLLKLQVGPLDEELFNFSEKCIDRIKLCSNCMLFAFCNIINALKKITIMIASPKNIDSLWFSFDVHDTQRLGYMCSPCTVLITSTEENSVRDTYFTVSTDL